MGKQARLARGRREMRAAHRREMAKLGEAACSGEVQAALAAFHDDECSALIGAYRPAQHEALNAAGWRQRAQNLDGIGVWDRRDSRILHSVARETDGHVWAHVSVSHGDNTMPGWYEVRNAGWLLYPDRPGIVVVAPKASHVDIANVAHVWYCLTAPSCPAFDHGLGTI